MTQISEMLNKKGIRVTSLYFHVLQSGVASLVIICELEKDKIAYIGRHFEEMKGVESVDWMNARTRTKQF